MLSPFEVLCGCLLLNQYSLTFPPLSSILSSLFFALSFGLMLMINCHSLLTPLKQLPPSKWEIWFI
jgi:hypothetical protein